ncbi:Omega-6 fatty acid desaturase, endoplasmic reticulum [Capsicum annuum]|uniref:Omega-6 fatty acid desaturase, endoplasmic reticulum n=1 Tax=Capsicum annuum TaxID=4072 RepID=A0A2G2YBZ3_CAPAN|nr:Omega-6 fatty acid desaturase, endoplasmic reticulum [Capsicum annuum]
MLAFTLTVRLPLYYAINVAGRPYDCFASHYDPYSPIYNDRERLQIYISDADLGSRMGVGGNMSVPSTKSEQNKNRLQRMPTSKLPFTIGDIKKAIPPHCFQRSLIRSFYYVARDLLLVSVFYYIATTYFHLLPSSYCYLAWLTYWIVQDCWHLPLLCHGNDSETNTVSLLRHAPQINPVNLGISMSSQTYLLTKLSAFFVLACNLVSFMCWPFVLICAIEETGS